MSLLALNECKSCKKIDHNWSESHLRLSEKKKRRPGKERRFQVLAGGSVIDFPYFPLSSCNTSFSLCKTFQISLPETSSRCWKCSPQHVFHGCGVNNYYLLVLTGFPALPPSVIAFQPHFWWAQQKNERKKKSCCQQLCSFLEYMLWRLKKKKRQMKENPHCYPLSPITAPVSPPSSRHAEALSHTCICISTRRFVQRQEPSITDGEEVLAGPTRPLVSGNAAASGCSWNTPPLPPSALRSSGVKRPRPPNFCRGLVPNTHPWPDFNNSDSNLYIAEIIICQLPSYPLSLY